MIFRDISFDGKEYILTFYVDKYSPKEVIGFDKDMWHLTVKLQSISEDLYKYYSSRERNPQNNWEDKITEPMLIHSNISGGLGILGACNEIKVFEYKNF